MGLALEMEKTLRNMSRYDKYGIGAELRKRLLAILPFVVQANSKDNKKEVLAEIRINIEILKQLLFLGKEAKAVPSFQIFKKLEEQFNLNSLRNHLQKLLKPYSPLLNFQKGFIRLKPNMYYKYLRFKHQISFYKKEFSDHTLLIKKGRFYEVIGRDAEELAELNRLNPYYKKGIKQYGFKTNRIRNILYSMRVHFMSGVLIRETDEITNKIKARIPVFSWRLRKPVQLELFKTEEKKKK